MSSYNILIRAIILGISAVFVYILYVSAVNKKIPYITYLGRNTITVYLLHGIIIRAFRAHQELFNFINPTVLAICLTALIIVVSANPLTEKAWQFIFGDRRKRNSS